MILKLNYYSFLIFISCNMLFSQDESLTLKELCKESSDIVIGTPIAINSYEKENGKYVFTDIDISIERRMKGKLNTNDVIRLTIYGGKIGDITTYAIGFPRFALKVKSIFFFKEDVELLKGPQRIFRITGLAQGKLDIIEENGEKIVKRDNHSQLKLEANGKSLSLSHRSSTDLNEVISHINNFINN